MRTFTVYMTIKNVFEIEADSPEEAEEKAKALGVYETLDGASYDVTEILEEAE